VLHNYRHPELSYEGGKVGVELDIYIPQLSLAFEYQGIGHFKNKFLFQRYRMVRIIDEHKKKLCKKHNLTLIEVPYWWDYSASSLAATIQNERPDILLSNVVTIGNPIPLKKV